MWLFFCLLVPCLFSETLTVKLPFPKEFRKCSKDDPALNDCIKVALQEAIPFLVKGLPKYGIVPIDPLVTERMEMFQKYGPVYLNLTLHNLVYHGNSKAVIQKAEVDIPSNKFAISIWTDKVTLEGNHDTEASIFGFFFGGKGSFSSDFEGISSTVVLQGDLEERSGYDYLKLTTCNVTLDFNNFFFNFKNLFSKQKDLGDNVNIFLNRFANQIYKEVRPVAQESQAKLACLLAQPFFDRVPFNEMFL